MSYASMSPLDYSELYPHSNTHAGAPGWKMAYAPGWGNNPLRAGPMTLGMTYDEGMAIAQQAAGRAAQQAAAAATITGSANSTVTIEESRIPDSPALVAAQQQVGSVSPWAYVAVGVAVVAGIGMIAYARKARHV